MIYAHHEGYLSFNMFTDKECKMDCDKFDIKQETILIQKSNDLVFYSYELKELGRYEISPCKKIKLSDNGKYGCVLTSSKEKLLSLYNIESILFRKSNIANFSLSNKYLTYQEGTSVKILNILSLKEEKEYLSLSYYKSFNNSVLLWESKDNKIIIYNESFIYEKSFKEVSKVEGKEDDCGNLFVLITSKYVANNYYGHDTLYYYESHKKVLKKLEVDYPPLFYDFRRNSTVVCSGFQPSKVYLLNKSGEIIKEYEKGIRNRAYLNNHSNLIAYCGFDNLSGNIEIRDNKTNEVLTKFKIKGASLFEWSPNGSYFIVSTTNYMKIDNEISVYDYYGRKIEERKFQSLHKSGWIGKTEPFIQLERPNKLLIESENIYQPPVLEGFNDSRKKKNIPQKKKAPQPIKADVSVDELKDKLKTIVKIKEKRDEGKDLSIDELNLLLQEDKYLTELEVKIKNNN